MSTKGFVGRSATRYEELREYLCTHDGYPKNGAALTEWVNDQRGMYREGRLSSEKIELLEALPGWSWNPREDRWTERYAALRAHLDSRSSTYPVQTTALGLWITLQRTAHKHGRIRPDRLALLEALPGWSWNPVEDRWAERYVALRAYVASHGAYPKGNTSLGHWASVQRGAYRIGKLGTDRVEMLEALPDWTWDSAADQWATAYCEMERFLGVHGVYPTQRGAEQLERNLESWAYRQRAAYWGGQLDPERVALLEALPDWVWSAETRQSECLADRWVGHYQKLVDYLTVHRIYPERSTELGRWVARQRVKYKAGMLEAGRAEELEALPRWTWDVHEDRWTRQYESLRCHLAADGTYPKSSEPLTKWIYKQRTERRAGTLDDRRAELLEALPRWQW